jgi:hypothetical protein
MNLPHLKQAKPKSVATLKPETVKPAEPETVAVFPEWSDVAQMAIRQCERELTRNGATSHSVVHWRVVQENDRPAMERVTNGNREIICGFRGEPFSTNESVIGYIRADMTTTVKTYYRELDGSKQYANGFPIESRYHTRRESIVFVVISANAKQQFATMKKRARNLSGWYSRQYKPDRERAGFMFASIDNARRFADSLTVRKPE